MRYEVIDLFRDFPEIGRNSGIKKGGKATHFFILSEKQDQLPLLKKMVIPDQALREIFIHQHIADVTALRMTSDTGIAFIGRRFGNTAVGIDIAPDPALPVGIRTVLLLVQDCIPSDSGGVGE